MMITLSQYRENLIKERRRTMILKASRIAKELRAKYPKANSLKEVINHEG